MFLKVPRQLTDPLGRRWPLMLAVFALVTTPLLCIGPRHEDAFKRRMNENFEQARLAFQNGDFPVAALLADRHRKTYPDSPHIPEALFISSVAQVRCVRKKEDAHVVDFEIPLKQLALAAQKGIDVRRIDASMLEAAHALTAMADAKPAEERNDSHFAAYTKAAEIYRELVARKPELVHLKLNIARCLARLKPPKEEEAWAALQEHNEYMKAQNRAEGLAQGMQLRVELLVELGYHQAAAELFEELARSGIGLPEWITKTYEQAGLTYLKTWHNSPPDAERDQLLVKASSCFVGMYVAAAQAGPFFEKAYRERAFFHLATVASLGQTGGPGAVDLLTRLANTQTCDPYVAFAASLRLGIIFIERNRMLEGLQKITAALGLANRELAENKSLVDINDTVFMLRQVSETSSSLEVLESAIAAMLGAVRLVTDRTPVHRALGFAAIRAADLLSKEALKAEIARDIEAMAKFSRKAADCKILSAESLLQVVALDARLSPEKRLPDGDRREMQYRAGSLFCDTGFYARAVEPLRACIADVDVVNNPIAAPALLVLGKCYAAIGDFRYAREAFEKTMQCAERTDFSRQARYERAKTYERERNYADAIQAYDEIFEFGPADGMSPEHAVWQDALLATGKLRLTLADKEAAASVGGGQAGSAAPAPGGAAASTALIHIRKAVEAFEEALQRCAEQDTQRRLQVSFHLARCFIGQSDWGRARDTLQIAAGLVDTVDANGVKLGLKPEHSLIAKRLFLFTGDCSFMLGDYSGALLQYEEAERRADAGGDLVLAVLGKARCHIALFRPKDALVAVERARLLVERAEGPLFAAPEFGKDYFRRTVDDLQRQAELIRDGGTGDASNSQEPGLLSVPNE
ncbi:MAG: tetratricopeptide repeat protein [Planctomycetota bacterium]|nr:tetratricopeptide repeat protein [Planctomycetota bacterium]